MQNFKEFGLPIVLSGTLDNMNFKVPTPIQAQVIPHALEGKDILGSAQTGTGKTGAFGIPLVSYLISNPQGIALVMTPTRELAKQVLTQLQEMLGNERHIKSALLIGGDSMQKQLQQIRNRPRIIVGTPGRINDHLKRRSLALKDVKFLVLDEIDRMLDMGFSIQIDMIMKHVPDERQTMLFSATIPQNIVRISEKYLKDPIRVAVTPEVTHAEKIKHEIIRLQESEKHERLLAELEARTGSIIVFVKTKHGADKLATKLDKLGYEADAIHGDLRQNKRDKVIANFRSKKYRILVATDVAARGLDIPHIEHVINYDLPSCAEDYIHRIGRTARAGAVGSAVCMITPSDQNKWGAINRIMNPGAPVEKMQKSGKKKKRSGKREKSFGKPRRFERKEGFEKKERSFERNEGEFGNSDKPFEKRERSFGNREKSFGKKERSFGGREKSFGRKERRFGDRERSFEKREGDFGNSERSFEKKERRFGDRERAFEKREGDFGNRKKSFGNKEGRFGNRERSFGKKERSFGNRERSFEKREGDFGNSERSFEKKERRFGERERSFGKKEKSFGNRERSFGKKRSFSGRPKRKSFD